jgi:magnesium chelatase subunit D
MNGPQAAADDAARGAHEAAWADALQAAALFAVDPIGTGGVALRALAGPQRERWLRWLRDALPADVPWRRVPLNIHDARLLGGLDLAATLRAGRPVAQKGLLAEADGGVLLLAMAERLPPGTAARLAAVLDTQEVAMERDGLALREPARLGVVALDEGMADDEQMPAALRDRLAFSLSLPDAAGESWGHGRAHDPVDGLRAEVQAARALLPTVTVSDELLQALCAASLALGIASVRAPLLALRVACAAAALAGRCDVDEQDAALAARLVLAPRATQLPTMQSDPQDQDGADETPEPPEPPAAEPPPPEPPPDPPSEAQNADPDEDEPPPLDPSVLEDLILDAARAAIPAGLLAALELGQAGRSGASTGGRAGQIRKNRLRGRPAGVQRGEPRAGARLNVIETLRAAAPWQAVRRREVGAGTERAARIQVRREDFHVTRYQQHSETTTVFVVDASGSSALNRLAEAKGAVELLLADCYVRRDRVAVLSFRGKTAELLLPPTRSLVRAKRSLAGLPGGGGTPLAAGIDAALALADAIARRGETPILVLLTDGRGNIARDGSPGRQRAGEDALAAARQVRLAGVTALLLDTSPQPQPAAEQLAAAMGAGYLPLPYAGAAALSTAVRLASGGKS